MATISLDVSQKNVITPVFMKQLDTGRTLTTFIYDNGVFKNLSSYDVTDIQIKIKKPDGYSVFNNATTVNEDGSITFNMTEQMLAVGGQADVEIVIPSGNETFVSTCKFKIFIEESAVNNSEIESSYEFNALNEALANISEASELLNNLQTELSNIEDEEIIRVASENTRISNENTRVSNENARTTAENNRSSAEIIRQSQEETRQTNTATAISNCETATENANDATDRANTAAETCEDLAIGALPIATSTTIGAVKASADVNVAADGTMSVPTLEDKFDKSHVVNSQSVNVRGFALDATEANSSISGTLAHKVDSLIPSLIVNTAAVKITASKKHVTASILGIQITGTGSFGIASNYYPQQDLFALVADTMGQRAILLLVSSNGNLTPCTLQGAPITTQVNVVGQVSWDIV